MQCPTCGKQVPKGQAVCSYCGALVISDGPPIFERDSSRSAEPQTPQGWGTGPKTTIEEEEQPEEVGEAPSAPSAPPPSPGETSARPGPPSWIRILIPLAFILIPLLNILWDSPFRTGSGQPPVLRQAVLCEGVRNGRPVSPKEIFSLREDQQLVLYSLWSGNRGKHSYLMRWYLPDGKIQPISIVTRYRQGQDSFYAVTVLPLDPRMTLGKWRVEILLDNSVRAQLSFELRE
ncbi:MAG: zinc ribbon domain-containing protein [Acidobacteria bacterium]|nr:zinc ribbon domain-containing protein [Acidobacteriota bacterium]